MLDGLAEHHREPIIANSINGPTDLHTRSAATTRSEGHPERRIKPDETVESRAA